MLLIGGIPITSPTVLSVTLAVGATQLAKYKVIVTRITAIEELAGVTILCSDKSGTLTTNKLTIDRNTVETCGPFNAEEVILLATYASRTENQDAIDASVVQALGDPRSRSYYYYWTSSLPTRLINVPKLLIEKSPPGN